MNKGFLLSLVLHAGLICVLIYGLPNIGRQIEDMEIPLSIDVIAAETLTPNPAPRRAEPKPQIQPKPTPVPKPQVTPPQKQEILREEETPEETTPAPELKPQLVEEPPRPTPVPETKPHETKEEEVPHIPTPVPRTKPSFKQPDAPPEQKQDERFSSVLKDLMKIKDEARLKGQDERAEDSDDKGNVGKQGDILSVSEIDAVRSQLSKCWNVPAGARDAKDLKIKIHLWMNADATVNKAKIVRDPFLQNHPFYKVAAERALSAVLSKNCNPLPLPKSKYDLWKEMIITFDPKEMLG